MNDIGRGFPRLNQRPAKAHQPRRKARAVESVQDKDRRAFLRLAMAQGVAAPAALAALQCPAVAESGAGAAPQVQTPRKGALRQPDSGPQLHAAGAIVRDFADPHLELLRLLREAAEIEHALMLQYLFAAFALRPAYADLAGYGDSSAESVLGVAIQEMQHLSAVNRLLVALGSCPHLDRQDFPYEPDIYPFTFNLEPLSRGSLARFVYCEAPAEVFGAAKSPADQAFRSSVIAELGAHHRVNHIGSLYRAILDMLDEVAAQPDAPITRDDAAEWREILSDIMEEGEDDHFSFFRSVFEQKHPAFAAAVAATGAGAGAGSGAGAETGAAAGADQAARPDIWTLAPDHPAYPSHPVAANPTAFIGHPNQIPNAPGLVLGWLGNLHYWVALAALDYGYRTENSTAIDLGIAQMVTAIWPIATLLPSHGAGMPFDPLSMGYSLGADARSSRKIIAALAREAQGFAGTIAHRLPENYDPSTTEHLIEFMQG